MDGELATKKALDILLLLHMKPCNVELERSLMEVKEDIREISKARMIPAVRSRKKRRRCHPVA